MSDSIDEDKLMKKAKIALASGVQKDIEKVLFISSKRGNLSVFKYLADNGVDIHIGDEYPLIIAVKNGHLSIVEYLVENDADIHAEDELPLNMACKFNHLSIVKYLVENGANIHILEDEPLLIAARYGHLSIVKFLVENGADIHVDGEASLVIAIKYKHLPVIKYLIRNGADFLNMPYDSDAESIIGDVYEYLDKLERIQGRGQNILRRKNLTKRKTIVNRADWQNYCTVVSGKTNLAELRKISRSVGLPTRRDEKPLTKRELCAQLAVQMEMVLHNPVNYEHPNCNNLDEYEDLFDTDLSKVSDECLIHDDSGRCFYIGDIVDQYGDMRGGMLTNPYNRQPWSLSDDELIKKRENCSLLYKVHELHEHTIEDLQRQIVRDVLIELDKTNHATNTDVLMEANFDLLGDLVKFFQGEVLSNPEYTQYTTNELREINDNLFEIDMLAKFLSITRGKMSDVNLSEYLTQFLNQGDEQGVEQDVPQEE